MARNSEKNLSQLNRLYLAKLRAQEEKGAFRLEFEDLV
jgi:hypothetical protein